MTFTGWRKKSLKNPIEGEEDDVKKEIFDVLDKKNVECRCKFNGGVWYLICKLEKLVLIIYFSHSFLREIIIKYDVFFDHFQFDEFWRVFDGFDWFLVGNWPTLSIKDWRTAWKKKSEKRYSWRIHESWGHCWISHWKRSQSWNQGTVLKFHDFSITLNFREITFVDSRSA